MIKLSYQSTLSCSRKSFWKAIRNWGWQMRIVKKIKLIKLKKIEFLNTQKRKQHFLSSAHVYLA